MYHPRSRAQAASARSIFAPFLTFLAITDLQCLFDVFDDFCESTLDAYAEPSSSKHHGLSLIGLNNCPNPSCGGNLTRAGLPGAGNCRPDRTAKLGHGLLMPLTSSSRV